MPKFDRYLDFSKILSITSYYLSPSRSGKRLRVRLGVEYTSCTLRKNARSRLVRRRMENSLMHPGIVDQFSLTRMSYDRSP